MLEVQKTDDRSKAPATQAVAPPIAQGTVSASDAKLLDHIREALRSRRHSRRTEETYCHWV